MGARKIKIGAIILAGGKNTRMQGEDKAFLEIGSEPIIRILIEKLKPYVASIIVVTNTPSKYKEFEVKIVKDETPDRGPLMGIYSGLKASLYKYNFVVACDMPFINELLIKHMIENINDYDVLIPKIDDKYHPLFSIYSKNCISVIEEMIKLSKLKISNIFPKLKTHFITKQELERYDKNLFSLININTKEDFKTAEEMEVK